jgi:hypothetical protein
MRKLGPSEIGENEAVANGKQRRPCPDHAHVIDGEQAGADEHIALGSREQPVKFAG